MTDVLVIDTSKLNIPDSKGGIYNSSIFEHNGYYYIIGRCESIPEDSRSGFIFDNHSPILFKINKDFDVLSYDKLAYESNYSGPKRIEDFRVFKYNNNIYINHSLVLTHPNRITKQVISKLDLNGGKLIDMNMSVDIQVNDVEKNWLFFRHGDDIKVIYSLSPLIILSSVGETFEFNMETCCDNPINDNFYISGSTNPTDINDKYYLSYYHYRDNNKIYHQIPYLLSKKNLQFIKLSDIPLLSGGSAMGIRKNVLYLMSHIKSGEENLLLSFGEGDYVTTIKKIKMDDIFSTYS
jgi:predicted GH43/DUF377 family glycosyl hydrolase